MVYKESPALSINMPVFNGEKYLRQAIDSILNQTFNDFEFIIIDDGSSDKSVEIIKSYNDKRIKLYHNKSNMGLGYARNRAIENSSGKYIAVLDCDDIAHPQRLEKQYYYLEKNKDVTAVFTNIELIDIEDKIIGVWDDDMNAKNWHEICKKLPKKNCLAHSTVMISKNIINILKYKGYQYGSEDWDLWLRLASRNYRIEKINEPLLQYRVHSNSVTYKLNQNGVRRKILKVQSQFLFFEFISLRFNKFNFNVSKQLLKNIDTFYLNGIISGAYLKIFNLKSRLKKYLERLKHEFKAKKFIKKHLTGINVKKEKSNILFFIPWMVVGGADKVILDIISQLDKSVFSIHIITTQREVHVWHHKFNQFADNIWHLPEMAEQIFHWDIIKYIINALKINVIIISNSIDGYEYLPLIKKEYPSIKIFDLLHGQGGKNENGGFPRISSKFDTYLNKRIVINNYLREYIIVNYGIEPNKISVIYNGIDPIYFNPDNVERYLFKNKFGLKQTDIIISFIGRLNEEKHPEHIIELARLFYENGDKNYYFFIAGDGIKRNEIGQLIEKWDLKNHVFILGVLDDVRPLLKDTDVLLVCSEMEGLPIVVLEAMSMGVPVVASNVGGLPEMIDNGGNGILVDYDSNFILNSKNAIVQILDKKKVIDQNNIKKFETKFSLEQMITKYQNVILGN